MKTKNNLKSNKRSNKRIRMIITKKIKLITATIKIFSTLYNFKTLTKIPIKINTNKKNKE